MSAGRERLIVFVLGAQGSGKSTLMRELVKSAKARGERVGGLDPNGKIPGFQLPTDTEAWLNQRLPTADEATGKVTPAPVPSTLLVFDDGDRYIPKKPKDRSRWRQIALTNRHADVDVIVTGRRLQAFPDELISGVDFLYLFQLSKADVNAAKRLALVGDMELPNEKYRFVRIEPKTADGNARTGRTLPSGGFQMDEAS